MTPTIIHLVDDASPGGVMRMLEHMRSAPGLRREASHRLHVMRRGRLGAPRLEADVIVSHLAVTWANLPMFTALRALNPTVPLIHVEHSYTEAFVAAKMVPRRRFGTLMRVAFSVFDRIVAVSDPQAVWLERRGFVPASRLSVINPSVDLDPFLALAPRHLTRPRAFGLIGRLDEQKGFDIAIRGFRAGAAADSSLLVFGEGAERARLEALAEGDPRIRFLGWAEKPAAAVGACDAVLMPSRWEAFGLVALEAQAAGRLLLTSAVDGMAEHARGGAMVIGANTAEAWAEAIGRLGSENHAERILRGRFRAKTAAHQFAHAWEALFAALLLPAAYDRAA